MKRALTLTALALSLAACGGEQTTTATPAGASSASAKSEQQRLQNMATFDVGTFTAAPPAVGARVNTEILTGVEVSARPLVMECLVDPKNRGADKSTRVAVDATLGDAGVDHKVSGTNLTPAGTACIEAALKRWTGAAPSLVAKNADGAVKAHAEFEHLVGVSPSVVTGVNEVSDVAGTIRLALPTWGECFAEWKSAPPRSLKATVKVARPAEKGEAAATVTASEVKFDAVSDPAAGKVAACLEGKLKALPFKTPASGSLMVPYEFRFLHSGITDALPDATPELSFAELDLQRSHRAVEVVIALGERNLASGAYDAVVKRFKAKTKPEPSIADLKNGCAALLAADDKLLGAVDKQGSTEDAVQKLAAAQQAKDPSWGTAAGKAAEELAQTQKDLAQFKALRQADEGSCPKIKN
jgi:hypothetical protein